MRILPDAGERPRVKLIRTAVLTLAASLAMGNVLQAQDSGHDDDAQQSYQTFHLRYVTDTNRAEEITSALRNMLPKARVVIVTSQQSICVRGSAQDMALAQKMLNELDQPQPSYQVDYTIEQTNGGQKQGAQHISLVVTPDGQDSFVKQGQKVPLATGTPGNSNGSSSSQVQYIDVGLHVDAHAKVAADVVQLHTKVEESAVAQEKSGLGAPDPLIEQTTLEGTVNLTPGQPVVLGHIAVPGSTQQERVTVVATAMKPAR